MTQRARIPDQEIPAKAQLNFIFYRPIVVENLKTARRIPLSLRVMTSYAFDLTRIAAMPVLFFAQGLTVRTFVPSDMQGILEVYKQCEDFLSLGPVPTASMKMVNSDIMHSKSANGLFCVIKDGVGRAVGVLDFALRNEGRNAILYLLMISKRYRNKGYGTAVFEALESYLEDTYSVQTIESGVQVNNRKAIRFWKGRGFQVGTKPINHDDGTTAYDMKKEIESTE